MLFQGVLWTAGVMRCMFLLHVQRQPCRYHSRMSARTLPGKHGVHVLDQRVLERCFLWQNWGEPQPCAAASSGECAEHCVLRWSRDQLSCACASGLRSAVTRPRGLCTHGRGWVTNGVPS